MLAEAPVELDRLNNDVTSFKGFVGGVSAAFESALADARFSRSLRPAVDFATEQVPAFADRVLSEWQAYCARAVRGTRTQDDPPLRSWGYAARETAHVVQMLWSIAATSGADPGVVAALNDRRKLLMLLVDDLNAADEGRGDLASVAARWHRFDADVLPSHAAPPGPPYEGVTGFAVEEFAGWAGTFVPTQGMLDEDWSAIAPKKGG